ncbi:MAG: MaoC/PaaZ C-terminal domain-containing protein [Pseudomonadota bacterium]
MAIDYVKLKAWPFPDVRQAYTEKDTMLYAMGVGLGMEPLDRQRLRFVFEKELQALPTMAVVLGFPGFWMQDPATGIDWTRLLHGEQRLTLHAPLRPSGNVIGRTRVKTITDKGQDKGAFIVVERTISDADTGAPLATIEQLTVCRGDGGYSANGQPSDAAGPAPAALPDGAPHAVCDLATRPEMALLYRLCADFNPLHADPASARAAGFERPILHGLATYAVAGHAILKTWCDYQPQRLRAIQARFSSPVYPGETIRTEMWRRDSQILFRASVQERGVVVLNNGLAAIAD